MEARGPGGRNSRIEIGSARPSALALSNVLLLMVAGGLGRKAADADVWGNTKYGEDLADDEVLALPVPSMDRSSGFS
ncbi:MAG: hypothetical protein A2Z17_07480 [Gammaproteobacteria bacterium RBG_16_66_13]|nr:MAG: hypothetical protein A2Z17_07480 [Gammaproteobacteria bacterium RBG_16_66_13]